MFLTRISVGHPVFATMIMVAIMVFGLNAFSNLPIESTPEVNFPVVAVLTPYTGAAPEAVETEITEPIEDAVATLAGIETISSTSTSGHSTVIIQFTLETQSIQAAQEVRDRIAAVSLPDGADTPQVLRFDPNAQPIISLALSGAGLAMTDLTRLAEDVVSPALTNIDGVGSATVVGSTDEQVDVLIDLDRLNAYNIGVSEVVAAFQSDNMTMPAGSVVDGALVQTIQLNTELESFDDFLGVVVSSQGAETVTLGDVATIVPGQSEASGIALRNGEPALAINVSKVDGGNTVEIAGQIRAIVADLNADPSLQGASVDILQDTAEQIESDYHTLEATLMEGALLAVVIVFLFLNSWRSTVITALTLPIAILGTLAVISVLGFTLNVMTMLALTLSIGILIDDAIVVRENITRHLQMGKGHLRAALDGTNEIGLAVLATTLSICAVFLPLAFMEGIVGQFFLQFGVTVSVAVLISLFVAFTLDPMMSSVWYDPATDPNVKRGWFSRLIGKFEEGFEWVGERYKGVLGWSLRHRILTMLAAAGIFVSSFFLVPMVGFEFIPSNDASLVNVTVETPVGSSQDYTALKARQVETIARGIEGVESTYTNVNSGQASGENQATIAVNLVEPAERVLSDSETLEVIREAVAVIPGADITLATGGGLGMGGSPIAINLRGGSVDTLNQAAEMVAEAIEAVPGTIDVGLSVQQAQPMLDIIMNRQAASDLGITAQQVGTAMNVMIAGQTASEWTNPAGDRIDVIVRLPEEERSDTSRLLDLPVAQQSTGSVPVSVALGQVADIDETFGPNEIEREAQQRQVTVSANVSDRILGEVIADVDAAIAELDLPAGVVINQGGDAEMLADTTSSMASALIMAIVFIYLVLASQFGSFLQPVAIMMALPLSLIGVLLGLMVGGSTLNMYSMIGFIMLMGLVVKNAILLVDNANQRMREGLPIREALIVAGGTRFRPIIMTTLAMIFGMLPLALALHPGSEQNAPMAHAVIGGLISSTLLTLLVVPVMLTYVDSFGRFVRRFLPKAPDDVHGHEEHEAPQHSA
ncbi:efflux RND transporter permease subunit [Pelagibacterium sp. H642]|uniref:efflux RND transporter permease subunit n=1 Tax=Pelagibacterium sp. H642 TaxID=1881069 RepID=UPI0028168651|nr:efflux RND transporter permease subunit [Pelagibacterium sp. H642]WMT89050.1 efflux RND transporter permease subunit [Pelagibacterium sp. H642]